MSDVRESGERGRDSAIKEAGKGLVNQVGRNIFSQIRSEIRMAISRVIRNIFR